MAKTDVTRSLAIAGGAVAGAILDVLVRKNILTRSEARSVIDDAARQLRGFSEEPGASAAIDILATLGRQYTERGS